MISLTSAVRRRPGMSRSEFVTYLRDVHAAIATADPGPMAVYRQNHVRDAVAGVTGQGAYRVAPDRDNITELLFDDLPALFDDLSREYTREKIGPDGANFSDKDSATALVATVSEVEVPSAGHGGAKVIAFVSAPDGVALSDFTARWAAARDAVPRDVLEPIRSLTVQERLPEGDRVVGYFGGANSVGYQGVLSLRFDDDDMALSHAGRYLDALGGAIDPARSWRALVDEVEIYRR